MSEEEVINEIEGVGEVQQGIKLTRVDTIADVIKTPDSIAIFKLEDGLIITLAHFARTNRVVLRVTRPLGAGVFRRYVDIPLFSLPRILDILNKIKIKADEAGYRYQRPVREIR